VRNDRNSGFTLVELAIVLVIIGLLVGGVLVGQDLIKAAEIRATASDIERYNTGAASFRTKYAASVPGDILATTAADGGLPYGDGNNGEGDGDGVLENNTTTVTGFGGENLLFWRHLSVAQMIPFGSNTYTSAAGTNTALAEIDTTNFGTAATAVAALSVAIPQLRIRETGWVHVYGYEGLNYYTIASWFTNGGATGALTATDVISPREAKGIDEKLDDGQAAQGIVTSFTGTLAADGPSGGANAPTIGDCYDNDTSPYVYATSAEDMANSIACALRIRTGF
jgi:prepilin-type N-terminal cleavage/methylation domain-containing protein